MFTWYRRWRQRRQARKTFYFICDLLACWQGDPVDAYYARRVIECVLEEVGKMAWPEKKTMTDQYWAMLTMCWLGFVIGWAGATASFIVIVYHKG